MEVAVGLRENHRDDRGGWSVVPVIDLDASRASLALHLPATIRPAMKARDLPSGDGPHPGTPRNRGGGLTLIGSEQGPDGRLLDYVLDVLGRPSSPESGLHDGAREGEQIMYGGPVWGR